MRVAREAFTGGGVVVARRVSRRAAFAGVVRRSRVRRDDEASRKSTRRRAGRRRTRTLRRLHAARSPTPEETTRLRVLDDPRAGSLIRVASVTPASNARLPMSRSGASGSRGQSRNVPASRAPETPRARPFAVDRTSRPSTPLECVVRRAPAALVSRRRVHRASLSALSRREMAR